MKGKAVNGRWRRYLEDLMSVRSESKVMTATNKRMTGGENCTWTGKSFL